MGDDKLVLKRRVYSILDLLGLVGGIQSAIYIIFAAIIGSYTTTSYSNELIESNFQYLAKEDEL